MPHPQKSLSTLPRRQHLAYLRAYKDVFAAWQAEVAPMGFKEGVWANGMPRQGLETQATASPAPNTESVREIQRVPFVEAC